MLKSIKFIKYGQTVDGITDCDYILEDSKYTKKFNISYSSLNGSIKIFEQILNFIYYEYKFSKECVLKNIKIYIEQNIASVYQIMETNFYKKHKKNIDKNIKLYVPPYNGITGSSISNQYFTYSANYSATSTITINNNGIYINNI